MLIVRDTRYTDAASFKAAMNGVQLCYELATPQTYQLSPQQVELLTGENSVWSDGGDTYLKYVTMNSDMLSLMDKSNADLSRAKAEIKVTTDGISSEVSKKVGNSEVISKINQSAESVKIQARKVQVDGTLIVGKSDVGDAISEIEIGGRNFYGRGSDLQTTLDGLYNVGNFSITTEDGFACAHVSGTLNTTKYLGSKLSIAPKPLETFTYSAYVKIKNVVLGTTNPYCALYFCVLSLHP
jgi:hypothetical protein